MTQGRGGGMPIGTESDERYRNPLNLARLLWWLTVSGFEKGSPPSWFLSIINASVLWFLGAMLWSIGHGFAGRCSGVSWLGNFGVNAPRKTICVVQRFVTNLLPESTDVTNPSNWDPNAMQEEFWEPSQPEQLVDPQEPQP